MDIITQFIWSVYQLAIFEFVRNGSGHGVVLALAGAAKTTSIIEACKCAPLNAKVLFVAFGKDIATELARRVPGNTIAATLHSFGFRAIRYSWGYSWTVDLDDNKEYKLAMAILPRDTTSEMVDRLVTLVRMCKAWLADSDSEILDLAETYECTGNGTFTETQWIGFARYVLAQSKIKSHTISYSDMVWLPVVLGMQVKRFDLVFIDETQDLNRVQVELALMAAGRTGRIIAVGDKNQAIFGFAGADSTGLDRLIERLSATVMHLSVTYRCARAIVALAQQYVPEIQAAEHAVEGIVNDNVSLDKLLTGVVAGDCIVSRTNAPLVKICLKLLLAGKRAAIRGKKDLSKSLLALVKKSRTGYIADFAAWLNAYQTRETERLVKGGKEKQIDSLNDKCETLHALAEGCVTTQELCARIESLFSDATVGQNIVLSNTHRAKGLEWNKVWMIWDTFRPNSAQEERNLTYVAITRAKTELNLVKGVR